MALAVAGEEGHAAPGEGAEDEGVGGVPEGGLEGHLLGGFEAGHVVEARSADDPVFHRFHPPLQPFKIAQVAPC